MILARDHERLTRGRTVQRHQGCWMRFEIDIACMVLTFFIKSSLREKVARGFVQMFTDRRQREGCFRRFATRLTSITPWYQTKGIP